VAAFAYIFKGEGGNRVGLVPQNTGTFPPETLPPVTLLHPPTTTTITTTAAAALTAWWPIFRPLHPQSLPMPIFSVPQPLPVLWHLCSPCLYTCFLASLLINCHIFSARLFVWGLDLSILQMCPACSSHLSVVFVTYHNTWHQITQHCHVNSHCWESVKSCALGSFAYHIGVQRHVLSCIACGISEPVRCCVEYLPATARSLFQRHCFFMDYHLDPFWDSVSFCLFDLLPLFRLIVSYPRGVRISVLKGEQKVGWRNCVSCHFLIKRLKHTKCNSTCFMWLWRWVVSSCTVGGHALRVFRAHSADQFIWVWGGGNDRGANKTA
jgi:hypothetical protein